MPGLTPWFRGARWSSRDKLLWRALAHPLAATQLMVTLCELRGSVWIKNIHVFSTEGVNRDRKQASDCATLCAVHVIYGHRIRGKEDSTVCLFIRGPLCFRSAGDASKREKYLGLEPTDALIYVKWALLPADADSFCDLSRWRLITAANHWENESFWTQFCDCDHQGMAAGRVLLWRCYCVAG